MNLPTDAANGQEEQAKEGHPVKIKMKQNHIQFKSTYVFENDVLKKGWEQRDGSKDHEEEKSHGNHIHVA